ncbi:14438_t:CDS:2, partial [Racocetra persica]
MPKVSKQKLKTRKAAQASVDARKDAQRKKQINDINQALLQMNNDELQLIYQNIALNFLNSSLYKAGQDSSSLIQYNKELQKNVDQLERLNAKKDHTISYLSGTLSQYICKQKQHISKVRAAARKPLPVDPQSLKASILAL